MQTLNAPPVLDTTASGVIIVNLTEARVNMDNKAMARKLKSGECIDLADCKRAVGAYEGDYILPKDMDIEDKDLCNAQTEEWIWSVGRCLCCDTRIASHSGHFYKNDKFECIWLR